MISKKIMTASIALFGLLAAPALAEQNNRSNMTATEVRQEFAEAFSALTAYGYQERDQALQEIEKTLLRLDREIEKQEAKLKENWQDMKEDAREKVTQSMKNLRKSRDRVEAQYEALKQGSEEAWEELNEGFADAYSDFDAAWENAGTEQGTTVN